MLAMHYRFVFDAGFDMERIRRRVAEKAPLFDTYAGLVQKAFLADSLAAPGPGGGLRDEYAAFYLWESAEAARRFLLGEAFQALSESLGRPRVSLWPVISRQRRWFDEPPAAALLERLPLPAAEAPGAALEAAGSLLLDEGAGRGLQSGVVALDPGSWEALRFTLWRERIGVAPTAGARRYEVLHLSLPGSATRTAPQAAAAVG